ncbi:HPr kinase/phosphorylase [Methyloraptor flagellatus]|uniref:HPr kinase/phosphatase C-terminal domain-containing protein n=1 Tax=Methyloraptor flagellatus TaxID=3162530 RepID=A0AAU7X708_9HYPH
MSAAPPGSDTGSGPAPAAVHASVVLVGADGVLIRGASGAGKSRLALDLIGRATQAGLFATLVADDRVRLRASGDRLVAEVPETIAGLVERRGYGILRLPHEAAAVIRLVIDLVAGDVERMPAPSDLTAALCGVSVPKLTLPERDPGNADIVMHLLANRNSSIT